MRFRNDSTSFRSETLHRIRNSSGTSPLYQVITSLSDQHLGLRILGDQLHQRAVLRAVLFGGGPLQEQIGDEWQRSPGGMIGFRHPLSIHRRVQGDRKNREHRRLVRQSGVALGQTLGQVMYRCLRQTITDHT